jgi:predicted dienelactone hydrolase
MMANSTFVRALTVAAALAGAACGGSGDGDIPPQVAAPPVPSCPAQLGVGYQVATVGGVKSAIWYPTAVPEATYAYSTSTASSVALNASPTSCARFPVVIFSHGLHGCGVQSLFVTETLARHGYVVVAPDHPDALCSVDGAPPSGATVSEPGIFDPAAWSDTSYAERFQQMQAIVDALLTNSPWTAQIDASRVAVAGHSLGGYTAFGLAGGWPHWKDDRIKAALLLSPYLYPYRSQNLVVAAQAPLMYQGAQFDVGITPSLLGPNGIYAMSSPPKYLAVLTGGTHYEWTNLACAASATIAHCLQTQSNAKLIVDYAIAFLDRHLKGTEAPLLDGGGDGLLAFEQQF